MKILDKVSVWKIVKSHWATLVNHNTKKREFDDVFTFMVLPVVIASLLLWNGVTLADSATNIIITALSILVGLLFNVIVLIFYIINKIVDKKIVNPQNQKDKDKNEELQEKVEFLREILANISYSILASILTIVFCLFNFSDTAWIKCSTNWMVYFLSSNFLFTVLMILKRIYNLFNEEVTQANEEIEHT